MVRTPQMVVFHEIPSWATSSFDLRARSKGRPRSDIFQATITVTNDAGAGRGASWAGERTPTDSGAGNLNADCFASRLPWGCGRKALLSRSVEDGEGRE
jgi:hypothetical protein